MKTHIIFGDSPGALIKHALQNDCDEFIVFNDVLSVGPLAELTGEGIEQRYTWLKERGLVEESKVAYVQSFLNNINQLKCTRNKRIVVWYAENTAEITGLYFVAQYFAENQVVLRNVTELLDFRPRHTGEINTEQARWINALSAEMVSDIQKEILANSLIGIEDGCLRMMEGQRVITVPLDYFDKNILEKVRQLTKDAEYVLMIRVVGEIVGLMDDYMGNEFIEYRIRELIESNRLEAVDSSEDNSIIATKIKLR